jgi:hypothetical protein
MNCIDGFQGDFLDKSAPENKDRTMPPPVLPTYYYLDHFTEMLSFVRGTYGSILADEIMPSSPGSRDSQRTRSAF